MPDKPVSQIDKVLDNVRKRDAHLEKFRIAQAKEKRLKLIAIGIATFIAICILSIALTPPKYRTPSERLAAEAAEKRAAAEKERWAERVRSYEEAQAKYDKLSPTDKFVLKLDRAIEESARAQQAREEARVQRAIELDREDDQRAARIREARERLGLEAKPQ